MLLCHGLAARGFMKGDAFLTSTVGLVVGLVVVFVFWPVLTVLSSAVRDESGAFAPAVFLDKLASRSIWGLDCLYGPLRCGVAWNTLFLAVLVGAGTTIIGLAFALIATRTGFPAKPLLRALSVLPIITPPFVIGLALILLFGRAGAVTALLSDWFGIPRTRWIYGLPGVLIAQLLAFAPIAFLVLIGVVQGISPSLEEAAQTLRASRWTTFRTVTWPLLRPGIANAFLLGFVESMADFGNPLVLSGNYELLSIQIFFAVVGAAHDQGRAAVLAIVLLAFTLGAFYAQQRWLGRVAYTTVTGKGDAGLPVPLADGDPLGLLCAGPAVGHPGRRDLRRHHRRRVRPGDGPGLHADAPVLPDRLRRGARLDRRSSLHRVRLGLLLDDDPDRRDLGPDHRGDRHPDRVLARPAAIRREEPVRVRDDALLRDPGDGHRRGLHPGVQRAARRAHRHRA